MSKFVELHQVISEFTLLKSAIFVGNCLQLDDDLHSIVMFAFSNGLEDRSFDFSRAIGNHFCTPCRNLARFGSENPEFKT